APAPVKASADAAGAVAPAAADAAAEAFVMRCSGCHTVGGGPMKGPDLAPSTQWAAADLRVAIKKMEKNAGPLSEADLDQLTGLLKDPELRPRLTAERQRAVAVMAASLDPPDPALGEALFMGERGFKNGGLPCAACHTVGDRGGALGPDLTLLKDRLPRVAMLSAFEGANYVVMRPAYAGHPVTKQEAIHLAGFFEERAPAAVTGDEGGWVAPVGAALALLALLLIRITMSNRGPAGIRARLVRDAQREAP
ncbi:MAG: hypothetical protein CVU56_11195, partial [Deltaproteobacteria bacterium HGW-Deltaproteobacteria-14]